MLCRVVVCCAVRARELDDLGPDPPPTDPTDLTDRPDRPGRMDDRSIRKVLRGDERDERRETRGAAFSIDPRLRTGELLHIYSQQYADADEYTTESATFCEF